LSVGILAVGCFIAAVLGDSTGYWFGHTFGRKIFEQEKLPLVKKHHIETAEAFYKKHGKKTIILARFVPAVRTFAPIVAGIGSMDYRTFLSYNIVGGLLWGLGMTLAGYFLGSLIPAKDVDKYLLPIVLLIIILSVLPALWHVLSDKKERKTHEENTIREVQD
jgi:membrane-associated protein